MQWDKYKEFAATHLELAPCLDEQLRPLMVTGRSIQDTIERRLKFIAVRPWGKLDLGRTGSYRDRGSYATSEKFTVYAHIGGYEFYCTRARASNTPKDSTVKELIDELKQWHQEYWATKVDRPLIFDAVTLTSNFVRRADNGVALDKSMALVFFLFPEGFQA